MDAGRHGSRSPFRPVQLAPCRYGHAVRGLPKMRLRPFLQALSAWGESRVSCLASRSYGVPGHGSVSPLL
ncbi:hypothetical protein NDU88_003791 [Pleurodeles waltl]|uniref:Uncharacterized protein n=1 Tax=Pleurodeles waltl TaxID=8319 RepID=A0AAV7WQE4_PLEWA|nr:hypothetical protein NDU88_003791 [Pleurodeles waltl]